MNENQVLESMEKAYQLALKALSEGEVPVGALFVDAEGKEIASGYNSRQGTQRTLGHAEIVGLECYNQIAKTWRFYPGASLFVTVEPCLMCTGALLWARVDNIYYGAEDPQNAGLRTLLPLIERGTYHHRFRKVEGGLLQQSCSALMTRYFSEMREEKKALAASQPAPNLI